MLILASAEKGPTWSYKFPAAYSISNIYFGTDSFRRVEVLGDHLSFDHNAFFPQRLLLLLVQVHIHLESQEEGGKEKQKGVGLEGENKVFWDKEIARWKICRLKH